MERLREGERGGEREERRDGGTDGRRDGRTEGRTDGGTDRGTQGRTEGRRDGEPDSYRHEDGRSHEFFSQYVVLTVFYLTPDESVYCLSRILSTELCLIACFHSQ